MPPETHSDLPPRPPERRPILALGLTGVLLTVWIGITAGAYQLEPHVVEWADRYGVFMGLDVLPGHDDEDEEDED